LSTPTETEFTGEENSTGTTTVQSEQTEDHPPYQHVHPDGTVHYSDLPDCGGLCPDRPGVQPVPVAGD
jgi:hypothetical protein